MLPEVINEYYKVYHMNLALLNERYPIKFLKVSELVLDTEPNKFDLPAKYMDLAKSIQEFGTYWIAVVDENYTVIEGKHRISALLANESTKDMKLPCLVTSDIKSDNKLCESLYFYTPVSFVHDYYPHILPYETSYFNPRIAKVSLNNVRVWIREIVRIAHKLAPFIFIETQTFGGDFYGSKYLNDEETFKQLKIDNINNEYLGGFKLARQFYYV
jgi:hypothetical protein